MAGRIVVVRRPVYNSGYIAEPSSIAKAFGPWDTYEARHWANAMNDRNTSFYYEVLYQDSTGQLISIGGV